MPKPTQTADASGSVTHSHRRSIDSLAALSSQYTQYSTAALLEDARSVMNDLRNNNNDSLILTIEQLFEVIIRLDARLTAVE